MQKLLVSGATGNVGRHVVSELAALGAPFRAMVRNPEASGLPADVEVVRGDFTDPQSLNACLDGVDTVFLLWIAPTAAFLPAWERIVKQARRVVYLSAPLKTPHPFFQQPNASRARAEHIEQVIEASGVEWTFLRPGMFAANARMWWADAIRAGQVVRWPYLHVPTAPIHEGDIAAVAVKALMEEGHAGADYVLTGPESLTHSEQIDAIARAIGREVQSVEISPEEARTELLRLAPLPFINILLNAWGAAAGKPAWMTSTFSEVMGRPPRTFFDWAFENAASFRA